MQALLALSRAIDRLNAFIGKYSIWLIFAATFISAANAIVRKAFDTSSNAFLEVQWYLFAWSFLIAAGYTLLHREHVRIDVINSRLSKKAQVWIDIIGFAFFLIMAFVFYRFLRFYAERPQRVFDASIAELQEDLRQLKAAADHAAPDR